MAWKKDTAVKKLRSILPVKIGGPETAFPW